MVNSFGYSTIIYSSVLSLFFGIGSYILFNNTLTDSILIILLGLILTIPFFKISKNIINNNTENNLYELNKKIFGKIGNIINIIFGIIFFILFSVILFNLADFFNTEYLPENSVLYLKLLICIPLIYISSKDINSLIKTNQILTIISVIFIILDIIGIYPKFNLSNFTPLLITNSKLDIIKSIFVIVGINCFSFIMLLIIGKNKIQDKERLNKNLNIFFYITAITQIVIIACCILILGVEYLNVFRFPEYVTLKQFSMFNILERIENILALQFFFNSFSVLSFLMYYIVMLMQKVKKIKIYPILVCVSACIITSLIFKNTITFIYYMNTSFLLFIFTFFVIWMFFANNLLKMSIKPLKKLENSRKK